MKNFETELIQKKLLTILQMKIKYYQTLKQKYETIKEIRMKDFRRLYFEFFRRKHEYSNFLRWKKKFNPLLIHAILGIVLRRYNTYFYFTRFDGKLFYLRSAGRVKCYGKAKKWRIKILKSLFTQFFTYHVWSGLHQYYFALHLKNVGAFKKFIVKYLSKRLEIRSVQNYILPPYNGCRLKKRPRVKRFKPRKTFY